MIIDFHVHLAAREHLVPASASFCDSFWGARGDWDTLLTPEGFDAYLEQEGVDWAVGLPEISPLVTGVTTNEYVWERFRGSRRLVLFANLNPWLTPRLDREIERLAGLGFRGVKLYPTYQHFYPNEPRLYPLYGACQALGLPVMAHTGSSIFPGAKLKYGDPLHLDDVAADFPDLSLLLVHGGRGFWYERAEFLAQLHPNVYLEVSGLPPRNLPAYFPSLERLHRKVVFGSDWPGNPGIRHNVEAIAALPLSDQAKAAILGGNAARILKLEGGEEGT
ncbi:MAG: amidohydrolase family protein [Deferrisomatales bacterium]|nr:amidohydrolase family protein [Deferrisomatales bacterium]